MWIQGITRKALIMIYQPLSLSPALDRLLLFLNWPALDYSISQTTSKQLVATKKGLWHERAVTWLCDKERGYWSGDISCLEAQLGVEIGETSRLLLRNLGSCLAKVFLCKHLSNSTANLLISEALFVFDSVFNNLLQWSLLFVLKVTLKRKSTDTKRFKYNELKFKW